MFFYNADGEYGIDDDGPLPLKVWDDPVEVPPTESKSLK